MHSQSILFTVVNILCSLIFVSCQRDFDLPWLGVNLGADMLTDHPWSNTSFLSGNTNSSYWCTSSYTRCSMTTYHNARASSGCSTAGSCTRNGAVSGRDLRKLLQLDLWLYYVSMIRFPPCILRCSLQMDVTTCLFSALPTRLHQGQLHFKILRESSLLLVLLAPALSGC